MKIFVTIEQLVAIHDLAFRCHDLFDGYFDESRWYFGVTNILGYDLPKYQTHELVVKR